MSWAIAIVTTPTARSNGRRLGRPSRGNASSCQSVPVPGYQCTGYPPRDRRETRVQPTSAPSNTVSLDLIPNLFIRTATARNRIQIGFKPKLIQIHHQRPKLIPILIVKILVIYSLVCVSSRPFRNHRKGQWFVVLYDKCELQLAFQRTSKNYDCKDQVTPEPTVFSIP